jgi:MFS family permease
MCEFERRHADATYFDLFKPIMINRTLIGVFTQIWSQLTGMNVMMYYITYVFAMAGYTGNANLLASSIQYVINVIMTLPALIWVDRWGRRPTMLVGSLLMATFMLANGGIMAAHGVVVPGGINGITEESMKLSGAAAKGLIACTYLFVASYAPTWGPCSWIYPPELYPLRLRGKGVALSTSANWAFNTALGLFTPVSFTDIRWKTYIVFGIFNVTMFIHVFLGFPEIAGKTLEETEAMFEDPNGIRFIGTPPWKTTKATSLIVEMEHGNVGSKFLKSRIENVGDSEKVAPETTYSST